MATGFDHGDVDVEKAEAADGAAEVLVHPEVGEEAGVERDPIDVPVGAPGEDQQEQAQFKSEEDKANAEDALVPADEGRVAHHYAVAPAAKSSVCRLA